MTHGADPNLADVTGTTAFDLVEGDQQLLDIILLHSNSLPAGSIIH